MMNHYERVINRLEQDAISHAKIIKGCHQQIDDCKKVIDEYNEDRDCDHEKIHRLESKVTELKTKLILVGEIANGVV